MKKLTILNTARFLLACVFIVPVSLLAQSGEPIGRVLLTRGSVQAQNASGQVRELGRRSDLYEQDTIITGPDGFTQVRMNDGAQISLKEDTTFAFNEYSFDGNPNTGDSAAANAFGPDWMPSTGE